MYTRPLADEMQGVQVKLCYPLTKQPQRYAELQSCLSLDMVRMASYCRLWWLKLKKWGFTNNELRDCGEIQTVSHIVNFCPLTKFDGSLLRLHEADEAAVDWLTTYGS